MTSTSRACSQRSSEDPGPDAREAELPAYEPYLGGSRYSLEPLTAAFSGLTLETTRDDLLLEPHSWQCDVSRCAPQRRRAAREPARHGSGYPEAGRGYSGMLEARRRWTGAFEYVFQDQSSLLGAAMLGQIISRDGLPGSRSGHSSRDHRRRSHERNWHRLHDEHAEREAGGGRAGGAGEGRAQRASPSWPSCSRRPSTTQRASSRASPGGLVTFPSGADRRPPAYSRTPAGSRVMAARPA